LSNEVVHFEINTADSETLGKFYSDLFGWRTLLIPKDKYVLIDTGAGAGINGGIGNAHNEMSGVTFYVEVPDPAAALAKIESLGGKSVVSPTETESGGAQLTFAVFSDVEGNLIGLLKQAEGDPPRVSPGGKPPVDWFEVVGRHAQTLRRFYSEAFDWSFSDSSGDGFEYFEIEAGPRGIAGGIGSTPDGQPAVRIYTRVDDLDGYLYRAEGLGAKVVMDPLSVTQGTTIAIIVDPQGNDFGIYEVSE
jgi:uncharacterized protein